MNLKVIVIIIAIVAGLVNVNAQRKYNSSNGRSVVYENKDFKPHAFGKVMVITGTHDPDTNDKIKKEFTRAGIVVVNSVALMPPVKEYSEDDIKTICKENSIEGIIDLKRKGDRELNGMDPINPLLETQYELIFTDLSSNTNAVTIIGTAEGTSYERSILKFFKHVVPEIKKVVL